MDKKILAGLGIAVVAVIIIFGFMMMPTATTYEVQLTEYRFIIKGVSEPLTVKAGETVIFKIKNVGGVEHEFMIVSDRMKEMMLERATELFQDLQAQGLSGEELIEKFEEEFAHAEEGMEQGMLGEIILEPGEEGTLEVTFEEPGTYWIICVEVEGTGEFGKTHAHEGMVFKVVVEE